MNFESLVGHINQVQDGNYIWQTASAKLQSADNQESEIWRSVTAKSEEWATPPEIVLLWRT